MKVGLTLYLIGLSTRTRLCFLGLILRLGFRFCGCTWYLIDPPPPSPTLSFEDWADQNARVLCLWLMVIASLCQGHGSDRFLASGYWAVQWRWFARVNALCNLSRKKSREVAASLPGPFLGRRCFTLCITMEVEPRIVNQYKSHRCCSCRNYRGKGMEGGKKERNVFVSFFGWPEDCEFVEKCVLGHPIAWITSYCCLPDTFWLRACKNSFKSWQCKIRKFKVSAFHCEESAHRK